MLQMKCTRCGNVVDGSDVEFTLNPMFECPRCGASRNTFSKVVHTSTTRPIPLYFISKIGKVWYCCRTLAVEGNGQVRAFIYGYNKG